MIELLYFAWVRERIGLASETVALPDDVHTVGALLDWLESRSAGHRVALADRSRVRVAVDQRFADRDAAVAADMEVAIFPPVTGG